jgi:2-polyprenyl-3-methyl-5-hydroxy-6-metoxy-1,4-benzoquinol methylase
MRDWRKYWRDQTPSLEDTFDDALREVGKTVLGNPISEEQVNLITETIRRQLKLCESDCIIDIGCGNGLLTSRLASYVGEICGFDVSEVLIQAAQRRYRNHNCRFVVEDVLTSDFLNLTSQVPSKIVAYEVLQHLSSTETKALFAKIRDAIPDGIRFFVGSVPDFELIRQFYNTRERWQRYEENMGQNTEQIGHWWNREEIALICAGLNLECQFLDQDPRLYTSHYRFDVLVHD